jgi:hypothetical protein
MSPPSSKTLATFAWVFFILPLHYQIYSKSTFDAFEVVFIFHLSQTEMILSQKSTVRGLFFHQQFQT